MTTEDIILHIFYLVATSLPDIPRHPQAKLYPSELVTIGILFALKGGYFRSIVGWSEIMARGLATVHSRSGPAYSVC